MRGNGWFCKSIGFQLVHVFLGSDQICLNVLTRDTQPSFQTFSFVILLLGCIWPRASIKTLFLAYKYSKKCLVFSVHK